MEAIYKRRGVRKYTDQPVSDEDLKKILKAGMNSPTAENNQEWVFIIIKDEEKRRKIHEDNSYAFAITTAAFGVLVCANMDLVSEPNINYWVQDLSASAQNMLIQAMDLGIASNWHGLYENQKAMLSELFELPKNVVPLNLLTFGYAAKEREPNDRYLEDRVHLDTYGNLLK